MEMFLIEIFTIYVIFSSIVIYNKSYLLGIVYLMLFIYCIFTMLGYVLYPEYMEIVSMGQYYGLDYFYKFYIYLFMSFLVFFITVLYLYKNRISLSFRFKLVENEKNRKFYLIIFNILYIGGAVFIAYNTLKNFSELSYANQHILKNNKLWFVVFEIWPILIYPLIDRINKSKKYISKLWYVGLTSLYVVVSMLLTIKVGQRIQLFGFAVSLLVLIITKYNIKIRPKELYKLSKIFISVFSFVIISQIIRNSRQYPGKFWELFLTGDWLSSLFDFKIFIFQDYSIPSLTLMTSMKYNMLYPKEIVLSNIINNFIGFDYLTVGEKISQIILQDTVGGVGYYYFTESFNFLGYFGVFYGAILIVLYYYFFDKIIKKINDKKFSLYIVSVIGYYIIGIVRGQSLFMVKGIIFYIMPFTIMYLLGNNKKIIFEKKKK